MGRCAGGRERRAACLPACLPASGAQLSTRSHCCMDWKWGRRGAPPPAAAAIWGEERKWRDEQMSVRCQQTPQRNCRRLASPSQSSSGNYCLFVKTSCDDPRRFRSTCPPPPPPPHAKCRLCLDQLTSWRELELGGRRKEGRCSDDDVVVVRWIRCLFISVPA